LVNFANNLTQFANDHPDKPSPHPQPPTADQAWHRLLEGNSRFAAGNLNEYILHLAHEVDPTRRKELGTGQQPFAVVLTCSDSRVAPELIFDQGLGDVFVIRTAGNVPDPVALGSIEYGVEHLKSPLLVVLGHTKCGAATATLDYTIALAQGKPQHTGPSNIGAIVNHILPSAETAYQKYRANVPEAVHFTVQENVVSVHKDILEKSPVLKKSVEEGKLSIVNAVYDIDSGKVIRI